MDLPKFKSSCNQRSYLKSMNNFPKSFQGRLYSGKPQQSSHIGNEEHWCETCDRSFRTQMLLENHKQQHQKCNIDGCQFVAHPKVITKHIQMQHSTGIYKKIAKLNNPEEVQKWLEERKKKYPTQKNMEKKAAEIKEKIERGEKMGLKRHHRGYQSDIQNKRLQDKNNHTKSIKKTKVYNNKKPNIIYNIPSPINNRKLKPFSGILDLIVEPSVDDEEMPHSNFLIDDDDFTEFNKIPLQSEEPKICGVLSSLVCNYGSSDEEENTKYDCSSVILTKNNNLNTEKLEKVLNGGNESITKNDINVVSDEDSGPEEQKNTKIDVNDENSQQPVVNVQGSKHNAASEKSEKKKNKVDRSVFRKPKPKKPPSTLLRKLLWKEMRQERNMVLQCIRYIVKNKYFDQNNS